MTEVLNSEASLKDNLFPPLPLSPENRKKKKKKKNFFVALNSAYSYMIPLFVGEAFSLRGRGLACLLTAVGWALGQHLRHCRAPWTSLEGRLSRIYPAFRGR